MVHCKSWNVFKKRANENIAVLASSPFAADEMTSELNLEGGAVKRGSFEITITTEEGREEVVWSGLKLGPPRRLKFPDPEVLLEKVKNIL